VPIWGFARVGATGHQRPAAIAAAHKRSSLNSEDGCRNRFTISVGSWRRGWDSIAPLNPQKSAIPAISCYIVCYAVPGAALQWRSEPAEPCHGDVGERKTPSTSDHPELVYTRLGALRQQAGHAVNWEWRSPTSELVDVRAGEADGIGSPGGLPSEPGDRPLSRQRLAGVERISRSREPGHRSTG
jgi:hypothetical protein